eukprot:scaffold93629_cov45-Phaeocystis_antarctica.AAC.1
MRAVPPSPAGCRGDDAACPRRGSWKRSGVRGLCDIRRPLVRHEVQHLVRVGVRVRVRARVRARVR